MTHKQVFGSFFVQVKANTDISGINQTSPIAERSKSADLDCGRGDPVSNPGEGRNFFYFLLRW